MCHTVGYLDLPSLFEFILLFYFNILSIVRIFPKATVQVKKATFTGALTLQMLFQ